MQCRYGFAFTTLSFVCYSAVRERPADMATAAHWHNWIYRTERRHWHAFWCRWSPDLELTAQFKAERIFEPLESGDGCRMQVIYHYGDERGTVSAATGSAAAAGPGGAPSEEGSSAA